MVWVSLASGGDDEVACLVGRGRDSGDARGWGYLRGPRWDAGNFTLGGAGADGILGGGGAVGTIGSGGAVFTLGGG